MTGRETDSASGGCRCGAVRFQAVGQPVYVPYCHCESCRRATGAPVALYVMFEKDQVRFTRGQRSVYASSPGVGRGYCPDCGTPLTYEADWGGKTIIAVHVSALDGPETFVPDRHTFYGERLSWFDVADALPRYDGSSTDVEPDSFGPA